MITPDGRKCALPSADAEKILMKTYQLRNIHGAGADILDWGGTVTALYVPDRHGKLTDVALGWRDPADYRQNPGYLGALIGRVANRISGGRFQLDGITYQSVLNDAGNNATLHGGFGYSHRMWEEREWNGSDRLTLALHSPDGDAGYPGSIDILVTYTVTENNELVLEYSAVSDSRTVFNPTNHLYFNLNGEAANDTSDLEIKIDADAITEVSGQLLPTGRSMPVAGTAFDLREFRSFGRILAQLPNGIDHNFVLNGGDGNEMHRAAVVRSGRTGIVMETLTDRPGVQFYMGGFLSGTPVGKSGPYRRFSGFCLETQCFPDAPNHPDFPSIVLEGGEHFKSTTIYRFTTDGY